jgi:hypothetical protein
MSELAATGGPVSVNVSNGGIVSVRRVPRSVRNAITRAVGFVAGETHTEIALGEMAARYAIVGATDLRNESGELVPFTTQRVSGLGEVCSLDVYNCLTDKDELKILDAASAQISKETIKK